VGCGADHVYSKKKQQNLKTNKFKLIKVKKKKLNGTKHQEHEKQRMKHQENG